MTRSTSAWWTAGLCSRALAVLSSTSFKVCWRRVMATELAVVSRTTLRVVAWRLVTSWRSCFSSRRV